MRVDLSSHRTSRSRTLAALAAVIQGGGAPEELGACAEALSAEVGGDQEGDPVWAFAGLLDALAMLMRWAPAVAAADPNPTRFHDAGRVRAKGVVSKRDSLWPDQLVVAAEKIAGSSAPEERHRVCWCTLFSSAARSILGCGTSGHALVRTPARCGEGVATWTRTCSLLDRRLWTR